MPTTTWDNLPEEKRGRVLAAAMREFGDRGFSAGSLNVIAREAGIAKGSVFQYFADKGDLHRHVAAHVSATVREAFAHRLHHHAARHTDLFDLLRAVLPDWVAWFRGHDLERRVLFAVAFEIDTDSRRAVRGVVNDDLLRVCGALVDAADAGGQLRPDVSRAHLLSMLLLLVPHLALAPCSDELDPVLHLAQRDGDDLRAALDGHVDALEAAFGAPADARPAADLRRALDRAT